MIQLIALNKNFVTTQHGGQQTVSISGIAHAPACVCVCVSSIRFSVNLFKVESLSFSFYIKWASRFNSNPCCSIQFLSVFFFLASLSFHFNHFAAMMADRRVSFSSMMMPKTSLYIQNIQFSIECARVVSKRLAFSVPISPLNSSLIHENPHLNERNVFFGACWRRW